MNCKGQEPRNANKNRLKAPKIIEIPSMDEFRNLLSPQRVEEWKKVGIDVDTTDGLEEAYHWLLTVYKNFRGVRS
ncbi:hypothetical protein [Acaryochloris marina]|nr:hypothetical protein [Acaryochloris marina]BDM82045.1 hypothetical protein AM10699_49090 [Acaryochloris marina MBIC10699]